MGQQVVHFEVIGTDPAGLRRYYAALFGWEFRVGDAVSEKVSQPGTYGFVDGSTAGSGSVINGGIGGGRAVPAGSCSTSASPASRPRSARPRASAGRA